MGLALCGLLCAAVPVRSQVPNTTGDRALADPPADISPEKISPKKIAPDQQPARLPPEKNAPENKPTDKAPLEKLDPEKPAGLRVRSDFPGGSGFVQNLDAAAQRIRLVPTPHKDRGWECWWYVGVSGLQPNADVTLDVGEGVWATPDRAFYSLDQKTWKQTPPGERIGKRIVYRLPVSAADAWFAWGPPFVLSHAEAVIADAVQRCPHGQSFVLCRSKEGRAVPGVKFAQPGVPEEQRLGIWIQARQHAWECGSSWIAQGLIEWLSSADPAAEELRKAAWIVVIPIMDVDNVEVGAGGKNQFPHDHNRDWSDEPYHPAVAAVQKTLREVGERKRLGVFLDLHNPAPNDLEPFFFLCPQEAQTAEQWQNCQTLFGLVEAEVRGPLAFKGRTRISGANYSPDWQKISKAWVMRNCGPQVASVCLETPWNTPASTSDNYRQLGRELGTTLARYTKAILRPPASDAK